uniref:ABC transporter G family member 23 n=3 Tax=Lygus hesperus TaxID=30085 RepID=A0A0A9YZT4_LYGHE
MEETSLSDFSGALEKDAVRVTDAYKKFGAKTYALWGLHMTVKQGTIYGLLGPSGCGKTTLLSCLIRRLKLDSGTIKMKIERISQMGYMPQNLSLFQEFSIKEHLMFFGYIHSMKKPDITAEAEKLMTFLELPDLDTIVSTLSGGQQRRVSLCIALLHNPELLILDEPTVGIDVVLSESIWEKLVEMSTTEGKTVIITTHYIQEARRSNTIGLMRNGKILAEDDPATMMREHDSSSLEDVFLKLCRQELILNDYGDEDLPDDNKFNSTKSEYHLLQSTCFEWDRVRAYSMKSFIWMRRNIALVLFTLLLPILQCTLISLTIGEDPCGIKLGIVNDEILTNTLAVTEETECASNSSLSREFLNILHSKGLTLVDYQTLEAAHGGARKNEVWGVAYFNRNYSSSVYERLNKGPKALDSAINSSEVLVWLDMSSQVMGKIMKQRIEETAVELFVRVIRRCNFSTIPPGSLAKEQAVFGTLNLSFRQFMTPANAVLFTFYLPMMFTLGAMLMEKTSGLFERSVVAGLTLLEMAIGHVILQIAILIIQLVCMLIVLYCIFENTIVGSSIPWCILFLLFVGVCGMFYGLVVAALCDSFTTASCLAIGSYFPLFILSGAIWPLEGMYPSLRVISTFLPVTSSIEAYRSISVRSWSLANPAVYVSVISLTAWTLFFGVLTVVLVKWKTPKN